MTYAEKLKDPRWQRKRLEILERDGWACVKCNAKNKTLHVHHVAYLRKVEPWNHPASGLVSLCEQCHDRAEYTTERFKDTLCASGTSGIDLMSAIVMGNTKLTMKCIASMRKKGAFTRA